MTFNIAVCDDNNIYLQTTKDLLLKYSFTHNVDFHTICYSSSDELINAYLDGNRFNIIFLDVELGADDGIELARLIRNSFDRNVYIVFISNYADYMSKSFSVRAFNYLIKPVSYEKIENILESIQKDIDDANILFTLLSLENSDETILVDDLISISINNARKNTLIFELKERSVLAKGKLSEWEEKLAEYGFMRISRDYLVCLKYIHYIDGSNLVLNSGKAIPIGRRYQKQIKSQFLNNIVSIRR